MLRPWNIQLYLDKSSSKALYLQIADHIIELIKNGTFTPKYALPSSRVLATELGVNRNTVIKALDLLIAEGWAVSAERKGLFVASTTMMQGGNKSVNRRCQASKEVLPYQQVKFDSGLPDVKLAPIDELARAYRQIFSRNVRLNLMQESSPLGALKFREAVAIMLNQTRGMSALAQQVCITRGSQMALYLIAHTLFDEGDVVLVENPGYAPAWETFKHAGATLMPIGVDKEGMQVDSIEQILLNTSIKAVYTTPHHQYPTTVTLSLARRLKLVELSNQYGFTIIEDDYDSDFHFGQRPVAPISSLSLAQNIIYIGTMSKLVSASLRVGYFIASPQFIEKVSHLRSIIDLQGDNIMEYAILELVESGALKRHIRKASKIYLSKRNLVATLLDKYLADKVEYNLPEGGLAFWISLKKEQDMTLLRNRLEKLHVSILPTSNYSFDVPVLGIRLGYGSLSEEQLEEGISKLAKVLR